MNTTPDKLIDGWDKLTDQQKELVNKIWEQEEKRFRNRKPKSIWGNTVWTLINGAVMYGLYELFFRQTPEEIAEQERNRQLVPPEPQWYDEPLYWNLFMTALTIFLIYVCYRLYLSLYYEYLKIKQEQEEWERENPGKKDPQRKKYRHFLEFLADLNSPQQDKEGTNPFDAATHRDHGAGMAHTNPSSF